MTLKRFLDLTVAMIGLILFSPVLCVLFLIVRLTMGKPAIFRQIRIGWYEKRFMFLKFRTMTNERDASGRLLPDEKRLTRMGNFLRNTSLDELPQLWCVFVGDMSLVGPRPLFPEYLPRYTLEQRRRHEVKPGITGWAQINGRNHLSWEQKFALDAWYVDHWSLWLDIRILVATIGKVISRRGITHSGHATMPEFYGNRVSKE